MANTKNSNIEKRSAGRPTKDSPEKRQIIINAIANKMPMYLACDYAMISRDTLNRWINDDEDFAAQVRYAKAVAAGSLVNKVCEDGAGAWKVLKNLQPDHFKDEVAVQQTNNYAIMLSSPDGSKQSLSFGIQAPSIPARSDLLQEENTSGDKRDTGGEVLSRSIMAANKDSNGSSGS